MGNYKKTYVIFDANKIGILEHKTKESQEICFLAGRNYREFIRTTMGPSDKGYIRDSSGNILGLHNGIINYTTGQRKGIGIASKEPLYVKEILPSANEIVVAPLHELYGKDVFLEKLRWHMPTRSCGKNMRLRGQVRYRHDPSWGTLNTGEGLPHFVFEKGQWAITPGQVFVGYRCDMLVASGFITRGQRG